MKMANEVENNDEKTIEIDMYAVCIEYKECAHHQTPNMMLFKRRCIFFPCFVWPFLFMSLLITRFVFFYVKIF